MEKLTEKQKYFLRDILNNNMARINILSGSVRSGKTFVALLAFIIMVAKSRPDDTFILCAKTITSVRRNCIDFITKICGNDFKHSIFAKSGELFGRKIFLEGANDLRAENKIRGMTLSGAYCDEITLFTPDFFNMLLSRLSMPNAWLIGTTNPDSPGHWLKINYIDRQAELNLKLYEFLLNDNTTLDHEFTENIKREFTGVFYDRFILGKWVAAEGVIYRSFADNPCKYIFNKLPENLSFITIGIDYGASKSKTVFVATGFSAGMRNIYVLAEKYLDGIHDPQDIYNHFKKFYYDICDKYGAPSMCYADYGALGQVISRGMQSMCISSGLPIKIQDCKKGTINDRIQLTCQLFGQNRIFIHNECTHTINAFNNAVWQENKIDTRLDDGTVEIDFLDAFEYSIYNFNKKLIAIQEKI